MLLWWRVKPSPCFACDSAHLSSQRGSGSSIGQGGFKCSAAPSLRALGKEMGGLTLSGVGGNTGCVCVCVVWELQLSLPFQLENWSGVFWSEHLPVALTGASPSGFFLLFCSTWQFSLSACSVQITSPCDFQLVAVTSGFSPSAWSQ